MDLQRTERQGYLPSLDETEFPQDQFQDLARASAGVRAGLDDFAEAVGKLDDEINPNSYRVNGSQTLPAAYWQRRTEAEKRLADAADKHLALQEKVAEKFEHEADRIEKGLKPLTVARPDEAGMIRQGFWSLPTEQQLRGLRGLRDTMIGGGEGAADAREYLTAIATSNRFSAPAHPFVADLISEVRTLLHQQANGDQAQRAAKCRRGAAIVRQAVQMAKAKIHGTDGDVRARMLTNAN